MIRKTIRHQKKTTQTWIDDLDKVDACHYEIVCVESWFLLGIPIYSRQTIVRSNI